MATIRIVVVDDHPLVRDALRGVCDATDDLELVGEAADVETAVALLQRLRPDVALVDVELSDGSGTQVCRAVRESEIDVRCLMLTSHTEDEALHEAVHAGAAGYVLKHIDTDDLLWCIRHVADGGQLIDDRSAQRLRDRAARGEADPLLARLSPQERRLLSLVALGMTNRQIASEMYLSEKTVKNYVSRLLSKLGMDRRTEAAAYAARVQERRRVHTGGQSNPVRY